MNVVIERPTVGVIVPALRIRSELFQERLEAKGYKSAAELLRKLNLHQNTWTSLMKEDRKRYDTRSLSLIMQALDIADSEAFELVTDTEMERRKGLPQ